MKTEYLPFNLFQCTIIEQFRRGLHLNVCVKILFQCVRCKTEQFSLFLRKSIMKNADYSVMAMQDIEKAKLRVALDLETDQLVMTLGSPELEEDIGLENVMFCILAHSHLSIYHRMVLVL